MEKNLYVGFLTICVLTSLNVFSTAVFADTFDDDFIKSKTLETSVDLKNKPIKTPIQKQDSVFSESQKSKESSESLAKKDIQKKVENSAKSREQKFLKDLSSAPAAKKAESKAPIKQEVSSFSHQDELKVPVEQTSSSVEITKPIVPPKSVYDEIDLEHTITKPVKTPQNNIFIVGLMSIVFASFLAFLFINFFKVKKDLERQRKMFHREIDPSKIKKGFFSADYDLRNSKDDGIEIIKTNSSSKASKEIDQEESFSFDDSPPLHEEPKDELSGQLKEINQVFKESSLDSSQVLSENEKKSSLQESYEELSNQEAQEDALEDDEFAYLKDLNEVFEEAQNPEPHEVLTVEEVFEEPIEQSDPEIEVPIIEEPLVEELLTEADTEAEIETETEEEVIPEFDDEIPVAVYLEEEAQDFVSETEDESSFDEEPIEILSEEQKEPKNIDENPQEPESAFEEVVSEENEQSPSLSVEESKPQEQTYQSEDEDFEIVDEYKIDDNRKILLIKEYGKYSFVSSINSINFKLMNAIENDKIDRVKKIDEKRGDKNVYMLKTEQRRVLFAMNDKEADFIMEL